MIDIWDVSGTRKLYHTYIIKKATGGGGGSLADKRRTCQPSQPEFNSGICMKNQDTVHP